MKKYLILIIGINLLNTTSTQASSQILSLDDKTIRNYKEHARNCTAILKSSDNRTVGYMFNGYDLIMKFKGVNQEHFYNVDNYGKRNFGQPVIYKALDDFTSYNITFTNLKQIDTYKFKMKGVIEKHYRDFSTHTDHKNLITSDTFTMTQTCKKNDKGSMFYKVSSLSKLYMTIFNRH